VYNSIVGKHVLEAPFFQAPVVQTSSAHLLGEPGIRLFDLVAKPGLEPCSFVRHRRTAVIFAPIAYSSDGRFSILFL
jgi:hypothetical protein